ncbi:ABC transporter permease [Fodinibius salsisoli]|uniref:ABC transporter permease n=1 Tax=Fodinibius salsisoli TaxID=2820877 RepID=A0ABT3PT32_9BACT|nr:ABC transporter permease [Fodinibius salsisoli]MCW9708989.1 ABC transporter permease [Fodinibius salsisoli]
MKHVYVIAKNTIRAFLANRIIYLLFFLMLVVSSFVGDDFADAMDGISSSEEYSVFLTQVRVLTTSLGLWTDFMTIGVIIFASGMVQKEKNARTIVGVLAKPVARWQLLVGKWCGLQLFFAAFFLTGFAMAGSFMIYWNLSVSPLFWMGGLQKLMLIFGYSTVAFVLGLFWSRIPSSGVAIALYIAGPFQHIFLYERMMESEYAVFQGLGAAIYYCSPALLKQSLIQDGILQNILHPEFTLFWNVIAENFLYSGVLLLLGVLLYQHRDLI